jgi:hypothetical protein
MGLVGGVSYYFNSGERKACPTKNCGEGYYAEWTSYEDKCICRSGPFPK